MNDVPRFHNAESVGFEPTVPSSRDSTLAGWCFRPLSHDSKCHNAHQHGVEKARNHIKVTQGLRIEQNARYPQHLGHAPSSPHPAPPVTKMDALHPHGAYSYSSQ